MSKRVFIGFDFSMNKPACTILYDKKFYFLVWPLSIKLKQIDMLEESGVFVHNRNLDAIHAEKGTTSFTTLEHTIRSSLLANMIISDIDLKLKELGASQSELFISSEGLSFGSKGDATLNLASYKGVLLAKLYEHYNTRLIGLYTFAPISIKSAAGAFEIKKTLKDKSIYDKNLMIAAFKQEPIQHKFKQDLIERKLIAKTNYIMCVDDIVDSYFALKIMLKKLKLIA